MPDYLHHDLQDRLDRAVGAAPPSTAADDPRVAGRRALRRRRAAVAGTAVALVLAGSGALAVGLGDEGGRAAQVAVDPGTPAPSTATSPPATAAPPPLPEIPTIRTQPMDPATADPADAASTRLTDDSWATFRADGALELVPDATVVQRIDDPVASDDRSVALELDRPGRTRSWYLLEWVPGSYPLPTTTSVEAGTGGLTSLAAWVATVDDPVPPVDQGYGDPVTRAADGTLTAARGVRILQQQAGFDVGGAFAPAGDTSAALVVRDGVRLFVLVRPDDVVTVGQPVTGTTDLAGFRSWASRKVADGWLG